jgi:hypothetical protein
MKHLQLYWWYPVKDGCPHCGASLNIPISQALILGQRNIEMASCPSCEKGCEVYIAEIKDGQEHMLDLTKLPNKACPSECNYMIARPTDAVIINILP